MTLTPKRSLSFLGLCVAALLLTAASAVAQDYEIKISRPSKAGETYRVTTTCQDEREMMVKFTGQPARTQKEKKSVKLVGDVKVLEASPTGKELRLECTVIECSATTPDGQATPVVPPQTKVTVFSVGSESRLLNGEGKPFALPVEQLLKMVLQTEDPDAPTDEETFGPEGRKKVGDSWPSNTEKLIAGAARQKMKLTKEGTSGSSKLVEVKKVNGRDCLVIEAKLDAAMEPGASIPGLPPALKLKSGKINGVMGKISPVDTSLPSISTQQTMNMEMQVGGDAPDGSGPVEVQMKSKRTLERLFEHK